MATHRVRTVSRAFYFPRASIKHSRPRPVYMRYCRTDSLLPGPPRMKTRLISICLCLLIVSTGRTAFAEQGGPFDLKDGDVVAFIGNTFVEREQDYSYLETLLRPRWPERKISFRNLGWS